MQINVSKKTKPIILLIFSTLALSGCAISETRSSSDGTSQVKMRGKCSAVLRDIPQYALEGLVMAGAIQLSEANCKDWQ